MSTLIQRSFAGGEIAPSLYSRVDTSKYQTGLRTLRNFMVMRHGGATNRAGGQFIGEVKTSTLATRLIPFVFNAEQTYVLEFGHQYIRFIRNGAQLSDLTLTITGISNANPGVVTYTGTDPSNGDEVYITGVAGALGTFLNGRNFKIANVNSGANTFELQDMTSTNFTTVGLGTYTSGGTASRIYQITTPYFTGDLFELKFIQSADIITIVHHNYAPRELARTGHTSWTLSTITFAPAIAAPTSPAASSSGSTTFWKVTAVDSDTFEESLPSSAAGSSTAEGSLSGSPVTITWTNSTGAGEYNVYRRKNGIYGLVGVAADGATGFVDNGITPDTSDTPPTARDPFALDTGTAITGITQANPAVVTSTSHGLFTGEVVFISGVVGMTQVNGIYFIVTVLSANTFSLADLAGTAIDSSAYTAWSSGGTVQSASNYPSTVSYIQQRLTFANTINDTEKVFMSRTGNFKNFTVSSPLQDDDAVTFTMAGRQVNAVKNLIDLKKLIVLTTGGEYVVDGDDAGIIKPTAINPQQSSYFGSGDLQPIIIGNNAFYQQARGTIIRDFAFSFEADGYNGSDLTIFSAHLFDGYSLVDWAYQQIPHSILWAVRSDGVLLGLTYVREHQLFAWHRHDFRDGEVESICCIPEGTEDRVYVLVNRTINGRTTRYIERIASRFIDDIKDATFMDSFLSYDGRNTNTSHTMTLSGGTDWDYLETLTLTSSASYFSASEVGNQIHLTGSDGTLIRFTIVTFSSATVVTGNANITVPVAMRSAAISDWARAVDEVTGLWHLEGEDVSVFGDGFVVANPNNEAYDEIMVDDGTAALDKCYSVIHVGLPYLSDIETLDIDAPNQESIVDKKKRIGKVSVYVEKSRGIWAGPHAPTDDDDDPLEDLIEFKLRNDESMDDPTELKTEVVSVNIKTEWNSNGRVFIRQVDPVPLTVLAIAPAGDFPFKG